MGGLFSTRIPLPEYRDIVFIPTGVFSSIYAIRNIPIIDAIVVHFQKRGAKHPYLSRRMRNAAHYFLAPLLPPKGNTLPLPPAPAATTGTTGTTTTESAERFLMPFTSNEIARFMAKLSESMACS
jgi:hypothetical protein